MILIFGLLALYICLVVVAYMFVSRKTENTALVPKSIIKGIVIGLLIAPSLIGAQGFALPAPATLALLAALVGLNSPEAVYFSMISILTVSSFFMVVLLLEYVITNRMHKSKT